jgi:hypothetical protein
MDFDDDLLARSLTGKVTAAELARVKRQLACDTGSANRYALLVVVGRSFDTSARDLVERFLVCPSEPALSRIALQILCLWWDGTGRYLGYVTEYVAGVPWDLRDGASVRAMALTVAGAYLRDHRCPDLLRQLLALARAPRDEIGAWDKVLWDATLRALGDALDYPCESLPVPARGFDPDEPIARRILTRAAARLRREDRP